MATLMGCIANGFTGATDLAGLLARSDVAFRCAWACQPRRQTTTPRPSR